MQNLSASDLLSLDADFFTAREEQDSCEQGDGACDDSGLRDGGRMIGNEGGKHGRSDGDSASSLRFNPSNDSRAQDPHDRGPEASDSATSCRWSRSRSSWREQSLQNRSQAKQLNLAPAQAAADLELQQLDDALREWRCDNNDDDDDDDDDDDYDDDEFGANNGRPIGSLLAAADGVTETAAADEQWPACSRNRLFEKHCDATKVSLTASDGTAFGRQVALHEPIRVRIEDSSLSSCSRPSEAGEQSAESRQIHPISESQTAPSRSSSSRLASTKLFLNEINNILAAPVAPPPSRACSEVDLRRLLHSRDTGDDEDDDEDAANDPTLASAAEQLAPSQLFPGNHFEKGVRCKSLLQLNKPSCGPGASMSSTSDVLLGFQHPDAGSISDNSYKLTKYYGTRRCADERKQFEERFENWMRFKKMMVNIQENPLSSQMDCLDRLHELESTLLKATDEINEKNEQRHNRSRLPPEEGVGKTQAASVAETVVESGHEQQQQQQLSQCANNLTSFYKQNQNILDLNKDFRTLLYNVICCLLVQDEQVLATPSVGKMLEVIRSHLNSASRFYSNASSLLVPSSQSESTSVADEHTETVSCARGSAISEESYASSSAIKLATTSDQQDEWIQTIDTSPLNSATEAAANLGAHLDSAPQAAQRERPNKPIDFRRVSSVSYKDQQLIDDLREGQPPTGIPSRLSARLQSQQSGSVAGSTLSSATSQRCSERQQRDSWSASPWAYQELSDRPSLGANYAPSSSVSRAQSTSQSSLEQILNTTNGTSQTNHLTTDSNHSDPMNDSGNGTMYEFQIASDFGVGWNRPSSSLQPSPKERAASICSESLINGLINGLDRGRPQSDRANSRRRASDFRPQQQPSYMSTDDYLSSTNEHHATSFYGDENNFGLSSSGCNQQGLSEHDSNKPAAADVAGRRSELEWTLNKLINIELKYTWLTSQDTLRRAIRKVGVPNEIRGKVWLILIEQMLGTKYDVARILEQAQRTIEEEDVHKVTLDEETRSILKQIELDVNRTMPGHRLFDDGAEGGVKLRLILVAYSIHVNRAIAYCQGFNFIVALLLSVFEGDEVKALSGFICIVDLIFPSRYYFDHYLTGARADQFLLADFICDQLIKNPTMAERKMVEGVTSSITLNWFISLFHGAVPTLTRLTILDHFMLDGVKALFKFTMAILYLAFQVTQPSSCEIFQTIRNTAKDMYDIKLLLSIVDQIKLPKDSYFAIRRSFYMVQSSFSSDQFYMQTLPSEANRSLVSNRPLSVQQPLDTKPPAMSLISSASIMTNACTSTAGFAIKNSICLDSTLKQQQQPKPRIRTSADRTKVCVQSLGKLGRTHLRVIDTNSTSNERSLMSPLRNCFILGISNCGKHLVMARQSSKRNYRSFREQDLNFHIHELHTETFDGFYLEEQKLVVILTHQGEIFKVATDLSNQADNYSLRECTETLMLSESSSLAEHEKVKLRLCTMDCLTNLLWIYVDCEDSAASRVQQQQQQHNPQPSEGLAGMKERRFNGNNPFLAESDELHEARSHPACTKTKQKASQTKAGFSRKIIIVDIVTFDLFSAFEVHPNFGEITNMRASLLAFCQLLNTGSNQFSTRIVQIGPTGRYEQLLSFSDVVDYMINVPESYKKKYIQQSAGGKKANNNSTIKSSSPTSQRCSTLKRLLSHPMSFSTNTHPRQPLRDEAAGSSCCKQSSGDGGGDSSGGSTLTRYYRSLLKSYSTVTEIKMPEETESEGNKCDIKELAESLTRTNKDNVPKLIQDVVLRSLIASSFGDFSELSETNYIPVNMAFIFRNGKIALFEFTESYAIHTREAQLDRYDYSKVIDVKKNGEDFIVTILTVLDKLIKVVI